jgi:hypothetical protein
MKNMGARDPSPRALLNGRVYKKKLSNSQRLLLIKALIRQGTKVQEEEAKDIDLLLAKQ